MSTSIEFIQTASTVPDGVVITSAANKVANTVTAPSSGINLLGTASGSPIPQFNTLTAGTGLLLSLIGSNLSLTLPSGGNLQQAVSPINFPTTYIQSDLSVTATYTASPAYSATTPVAQTTVYPTKTGSSLRVRCQAPWYTSANQDGIGLFLYYTIGTGTQTLAYYAQSSLGDTANSPNTSIAYIEFIIPNVSQGTPVLLQVGATLSQTFGTSGAPKIASSSATGKFSGLSPFALMVQEIPSLALGGVSVPSQTIVNTPVTVSAASGLTSLPLLSASTILQSQTVTKLFPNTVLLGSSAANIQNVISNNSTFGLFNFLAPTGTAASSQTAISSGLQTLVKGGSFPSALFNGCNTLFGGGLGQTGSFTVTLGSQRLSNNVTCLNSELIVWETNPNGSAGLINLGAVDLSTQLVGTAITATYSNFTPVGLSSLSLIGSTVLPFMGDDPIEVDVIVTVKNTPFSNGFGSIVSFFSSENVSTPIVQVYLAEPVQNGSGSFGVLSGRITFQVPSPGAGKSITLSAAGAVSTTSDPCVAWVSGFFEEISTPGSGTAATSTSTSTSTAIVQTTGAYSPDQFVNIPLPANVPVTVAYTSDNPLLSAMQTLATKSLTLKYSYSDVYLVLNGPAQTTNTTVLGCQLCAYRTDLGAIPPEASTWLENGALTTGSLDNSGNISLHFPVVIGSQNGNVAGATISVALGVAYTQAASLNILSPGFTAYLVETLQGTQGNVETTFMYPPTVTVGTTYSSDTQTLGSVTTIKSVTVSKRYSNSFLKVSGSITVRGTSNNANWFCQLYLYGSSSSTATPIVVNNFNLSWPLAGSVGAGMTVTTRGVTKTITLDGVLIPDSVFGAGNFTFTLGAAAQTAGSCQVLGANALTITEVMPFAALGDVQQTPTTSATANMSLVVATKTPTYAQTTSVVPAGINISPLNTGSSIVLKGTFQINAATGNTPIEGLVCFYNSSNTTTPLLSVTSANASSTQYNEGSGTFMVVIPSPGIGATLNVLIGVASLTTGATTNGISINWDWEEFFTPVVGSVSSFTPAILAGTTAGTVTYTFRVGQIAWLAALPNGQWLVLISVQIKFYLTGSVGSLFITGIPLAAPTASQNYTGATLSPIEYVNPAGSTLGAPQATFAYPQTNPSQLALIYNQANGTPVALTAAMVSSSAATPTNIGAVLFAKTTTT